MDVICSVLLQNSLHLVYTPPDYAECRVFSIKHMEKDRLKHSAKRDHTRQRYGGVYRVSFDGHSANIVFYFPFFLNAETICQVARNITLGHAHVCRVLVQLTILIVLLCVVIMSHD